MDNQTETSISVSTTNSKEANYNKQVVSTHYGQLKSHKYDEATLAQMAQRLNAIVYSMGFAKINSSEILLNLARWIKEQFGDLSMQEVALAFDLVTAKKIGSEIRHYNTFSQQYIGEVLHAFKDFRGKQLKLHKESEENKRLNEPKPQVSGKDMYEGMKRMALEKGEVMKVGDWSAAYNYAWKENLIHRMNEQEREDYKQAVISAMKTEKRANFQTPTESIQIECHKRILQAHFQGLIQ